MGNLRDIRRRIKSVKNTSQITRAMQMVASAKMRRAQDQAVKGRPYVRALAEVLYHLQDEIDTSNSPLMQTHGGADLVLLVNTNPNGKTYEANEIENNGQPREGTKYFADLVSEAIAANEPVGIGDIAFANGADNALMEELKQRELLFKLRAFSGWNTATNSTGFVLGQGMLSARMSDAARDQLLLTRYLDDWAYQSNVRQTMAHQLGWFRGSCFYASLNEKKAAAERRSTNLMRRFVEDNLPPFDGLQDVTVTFPWNRMFEASVTIDDE